MTVKLRPYQLEIADDVRAAYRQGFKCPLVVASTGAGKTVIFSYITHGASQRGNPVLLSAHRKEIIRQISMSLAKFGIEHQVIAPPKLVRQIQVAHYKAFDRIFVKSDSIVMVGSVQTIVSRFEQIDATVNRAQAQATKQLKLLIVMDEGHHVTEATQWGRVMDRYHTQFKGLGLIVTATPERLDGRGLGVGHGGYADTLIEGPPMSWLIENDYLSPYDVFTSAKKVDTSGVGMRMGDFIAQQLEQAADKPTITGDAIDHYRRRANGMRAVIFCVSVRHSMHVAEMFNAAGIPAAHIDGEVDDDVRDQSIMDFADGKISVLTQVNLVSEGFDLGSIAQKDVTIDCVIDLAPTESLVNFMQRGGRMLRPRPGKCAVYLDHAGNFMRHGMLEEDRAWSLEGRKKSKRKADNDNEPGIDRLSTCPQCFSIHLPAPVCPGTMPDGTLCRYEYPVQYREIKEEAGELVKITAEELDEMRRVKRVMQGKAQSLEQLLAQGISRPRAMKIIAAREAKQELVDGIMQALDDIRDKTGQGPYAASGHTLTEIRRMKPKQLKDMQAKLLLMVTAA